VYVRTERSEEDDFKEIVLKIDVSSGKRSFNAMNQRKTALSVSTSIEIMAEEDQLTMWPMTSVSDTDIKRARCHCFERISHQDVEDCCDSQVVEPAGKKEKALFESMLQERFLAKIIMQGSTGFCSPILKEDRGCESWRDLL
jgi:hypothetical protein